MSSTFTRFFPVPKVLTRPVVGFDISDDSVKVAELVKKGGTFKVGTFGEMRLPSGAIEKGVIKDEATLKKALEEAKKKFDLEDVAVSLPEEKSYIFDLTIPYTSPKEIRSTIELQLEEHVPLPADSIVFDYNIANIKKETKELHTSVAALPKEVVETYLSVIESAGMTPLSFETEAQAIARSVVPRDEKGTVMIVDFGNSRTIISVVSAGVTVFNTIHTFGSKEITEAIMKERKVEYAEAEKMKIEYGIAKDTGGDDMFSFIFPSLAVLKDEVTKYYSYWNGRVGKDEDKKEPIKKIIFSGGGSALRGLTDFWGGYLEVNFTFANVWSNVFDLERQIPPIQKKDSYKFATAIGLSLGSETHD